MHNSVSAPTLYYGTSHRPLQIQPHSELVERFSLHPILSVPQSDADDTEGPAQDLASSAPALPEYESQDTRASFSRQEARPAGHSATSAESQHQLSGSTQGQDSELQCLSSELDCADGMAYRGLAICPIHSTVLSTTLPFPDNYTSLPHARHTLQTSAREKSRSHDGAALHRVAQGEADAKRRRAHGPTQHIPRWPSQTQAEWPSGQHSAQPGGHAGPCSWL